MRTEKEAQGVTTASTDEAWARWEARAHKLLTSAMRESKVSYKQLSRLLEDVGISEAPDVLNRKVNRKKFSAAFYLVCMEAIKAKGGIPKPPEPAKGQLLTGWPPRSGV